MRSATRRTLLTGLALALIVGAAGCAKKAVQAPPTPPPAPPVETPPTPPPAPPVEPQPTPAPPEVTNADLKPAFFDFDSYALRDDARKALDTDAQLLRDHSNLSVTIEGHCDERGTAEYNVALGQRRAEAVKRYLADLGVGSPIRSVSFGKETPLVRGSGEEAWRENRRAELRQPGERLSDGSAATSP